MLLIKEVFLKRQSSKAAQKALDEGLNIYNALKFSLVIFTRMLIQ